MATRKSGGKASARMKPNTKGQVCIDMAAGTTVSGPSHRSRPLTELPDHAAEQTGFSRNNDALVEYGGHRAASQW
jgi:hypothetical protein